MESTEPVTVDENKAEQTVESAPEEVKTEETPVQPEQTEQPKEEPKQEPEKTDGLPGGVKTRLAKQTQKINDYKSQVQELEKQLEEYKNQPEKTKDDFSTDAEFLKHQVKSELKTEQLETQRESLLEAHQRAINEQYREVLGDDLIKAASEKGIKVPPEINSMIIGNDNGRQIAEYLVENPQEAQQITSAYNSQNWATYTRLTESMLSKSTAPKATKDAPEPTPSISTSDAGKMPKDMSSMSDSEYRKRFRERYLS
jgi:hypothetical protein